MKALIVVDVQNDFLPGGALEVKEGNKIIPNINKILTKFDLVIFTMDWHTKNNVSFASRYNEKPFVKFKYDNGKIDIIWPDHCVQNTFGAQLSSDLKLQKLNNRKMIIFKKGWREDEAPYSAFGQYNDEGNNELAEILEKYSISNVYVCGLALDYCVKETALDSQRLGYNTHIILDACKGISEDESETIQQFLQHEIILLNHNDL